jgi:hypothetical protein
MMRDQTSPTRHSTVKSDVVTIVAGVRGSRRIMTSSPGGVGSSAPSCRTASGPSHGSHQTLAEFRRTLESHTPPLGLTPALVAL